MKKPFLHRVIRRFCGERDGSVMVETVVCLPLLIWALVATYEFFEVHRYRSVREKATYTIADMLSRETSSINATYMDNTLRLFDGISGDDGINQIRVSVVQHHKTDPADPNDAGYFSVWWSEVRGTGDLTILQDADVQNAHAILPMMNHGEQVILVESISDYKPWFNVGLGSVVPIDTRLFTKIRFSGQLCWDTQHCGDNPGA